MKEAVAGARGIFELALILPGMDSCDDAAGFGMDVDVVDEAVMEPGASDPVDCGIDPARALGMIHAGVVPVEDGVRVDLQH